MTTSLEARARELAEHSGLRCFDTDGIDCERCAGCDKRDRLAAAMVQLVKSFAADALRQWAFVKHGKWWVSEGAVFRIVGVVPDEGPSGPPFDTREEAEAHLSKIIAAAIQAAAAEQQQKGEGK